MMKDEWAGDYVFLTHKVEAKPDGPRNMAGLWKAVYELDGLLGRAVSSCMDNEENQVSHTIPFDCSKQVGG